MKTEIDINMDIHLGFNNMDMDMDTDILWTRKLKWVHSDVRYHLPVKV
jgi:hypothetical protein